MITDVTLIWAGVGTLALLLIGAVIYVSIVQNRLKSLVDIKSNFTIAENWSDEYSKYRTFLELPETIEIEGRLRIRAIPIDHWFDERIPIPPGVETIAIRKDLRIASAPGGYSNYRHYAFYLPESKSELNRFIKEKFPEFADVVGKDIDRRALAKLVEKRIDADYEFFQSVVEERVSELQSLMLFASRRKETTDYFKSIFQSGERKEEKRVI